MAKSVPQVHQADLGEGVYTTGRASAVGLTAAVHRSVTGEWTLEEGPWSLDRGTCLIDEFDKMNDQDGVSLRRPWSSKMPSVRPNCDLPQARCSVIAAAHRRQV